MVAGHLIRGFVLLSLHALKSGGDLPQDPLPPRPAAPWIANDIYDIDVLSIAVPYCDAVFTDEAARNTLAASRELEAKARELAGLKGYVTNLKARLDGTSVTADLVISAYHQLWQIEKSFRMSEHDLQTRPIYDRKRDSIEAHLTIVFAALAITRWIERQTGWSARKVRQDRPPLPQHRNPGRPPHHHHHHRR